jgi:MYXO-CTERM domain-containing protein
MRTGVRVCLLGVLLVAGRAHGYGESDAEGFPSWEERVIHEWMNRSRSDPQADLADCPGSNCSEKACYAVTAPLVYDLALNRAARFHSAEMKEQGYFAHDSACTIVPNINALFPGRCNGAAACACVGGQKACNPTCTNWSGRIGLFGGHAAGEIIASPSDPEGAFYLWLWEPYAGGQCAFNQQNGHRYLILKGGPLVGTGVAPGGDSVGDFGSGGGSIPKIPSGAHYPRQAATVDLWANWYDAEGPTQALVNVDGTCNALTLWRGTRPNGAFHAALSGVGSGCHRYFFVFRDARNSVVTYPTTGSLGIGGATCADWSPERPPTGQGCDCAPQCAGKSCGDDGCGGSCGNCPAGQQCREGRCLGGGCGCAAAEAPFAGAWVAVVAIGLALRRRKRLAL